jgi:hypothetical protein
MNYRILKNVDSKIKINHRTDKNGEKHYDMRYEVNEYLKDGWKLVGSPFLDKEGNILQAMTTDDIPDGVKIITEAINNISLPECRFDSNICQAMTK